MNNLLDILYSNPFPSTRNGALFNAFSYPTKISPEAIAIFIACHTKPGDTVLDPFGGSGTTGIATMLCDKPTTEMLSYVAKNGLNPQWGPRNAVIYELSPIGAMAGAVMCSGKSSSFELAAKKLLALAKEKFGDVYKCKGPKGETGELRYAIWSDLLICPSCNKTIPYGSIAVSLNPVTFHDEAKCPFCSETIDIPSAERAVERFRDKVTNSMAIRKRRIPLWIYGTSGKSKWHRSANIDDVKSLRMFHGYGLVDNPVVHPMKWGVLFRNGYHKGVTHLHHFYTERNFYVFSHLWSLVDNFPKDVQPWLRVWLLSYNMSHSTLMTRVVAKKNSPDFVITGSQPGVLYISGLPVEKNIITGLERKIQTFVEAFRLIEGSRSSVIFRNASSTNLIEGNASIDYVFTDPPFGDYIPYSELNQINEAWLGVLTCPEDEVVVNESQNKAVDDYRSLMTKVFNGLQRVMKENASCTLVFHSAKSDIWRAIISAYRDNGFVVGRTSILDKKQASFKQTNSNITVKGDPLILLENRHSHETCILSVKDDKEIAQRILNDFSHVPSGKEKSEWMFSRYITSCIEAGVKITLDAQFFFDEKGKQK